MLLNMALRCVINFYCVGINICDVENILHTNVLNINEIYILGHVAVIDCFSSFGVIDRQTN
jgi:hypothetical protein